MAYAILVRFALKSEGRRRFLDLVRENAAISIAREPGCQRFDVLDAADSEDVYLYEIYDDRAAFETHLATPHFKSFDGVTAALVDSKHVTTGMLFECAKER